jgi:hypothetical protein
MAVSGATSSSVRGGLSSSGWICSAMPWVSATSTKISGSTASAGWKKAKQRRS